MPAARLYEGNMRSVMDLLARFQDKLEIKMAAQEATLAGVVHEVRALRGQKSTTCTTVAGISQPLAQAQSTPARTRYTNENTGGATSATIGISSFGLLNEARSATYATMVDTEHATVVNWAESDNQNDNFQEPRHVIRTRLRKRKSYVIDSSSRIKRLPPDRQLQRSERRHRVHDEARL